jgi:hypothetical protein
MRCGATEVSFSAEDPGWQVSFEGSMAAPDCEKSRVSGMPMLATYLRPWPDQVRSGLGDDPASVIALLSRELELCTRKPRIACSA